MSHDLNRPPSAPPDDVKALREALARERELRTQAEQRVLAMEQTLRRAFADGLYPRRHREDMQ